MTAAFYVFLFAYALEGFVRYLLNIAGSDALIFTRDALLYVGLAHLLVLQLRTGRIRVFFLVWVLLLLFHGLIGFANLRQLWPVVAGAKAFTLLFFGCLAASLLFDSTRRMSRFIALLWFVSVVGAFFDKYLLDWPWIGMTTNLGGLEVDIGRKWEVGIGNERVAGLSRSSIHLATIAAIFGVWLMFELRSGLLKLAVAAATVAVLFWSTQKGPILGFALVSMVSFMPQRTLVPALKWVVTVALVLMIAVPIITPGYVMPRAEGLFSLMSFYDRVERMWPDAWDWVARREAAPFLGVGLGGIGGSLRWFTSETAFFVPDLRAYAPYMVNYADNLFVFIYVQFGAFSLLYILLVYVRALKLERRYQQSNAKALAILAFICLDGIIINIIEDQLASMFLGASAYFIWKNARRQPAEQASRSGGMRQVRVKARFGGQEQPA